ncbi:MAG TPA: hypothetical protein VK646_08880 [Actinomycetota bacterium]|nr:hypothetical protein [Actinomycetota bacterium]
MTHAIRVRRVFIATLLLTAIITTFPGAPASAMRTQERRPHTISAITICPIPWQHGPREVKRLIGCVARFYGVGAGTAIAIAYRESKFQPRAYNARSCAKGIYQHLCRYWPTRADDYGFAGWSAFNARANIFVTMRMVRQYGWWPWR